MTPKRPPKDERERMILLGLVDLYLETGIPVGSSTLREKGFQNLSSATIRNYFAKLEKDGYLKQQHSSGGRTPTELGFKVYVHSCLKEAPIKDKETTLLKEKLTKQTRQVASYLQNAADVIAQVSKCAVFLSSPRFDQDFVLDIKLVEIDLHRCLCILVTDFGMVHTEVLYTDKELSRVNLNTISQYFSFRISGLEKPKLSPEEEKIASSLYKEIMLRHIVSYSNFSSEDIYKTGFSNLLNYADFNTAATLASSLSLFENESDLRALLKMACDEKELCCFLSDDLQLLSTKLSGCSLLIIPYQIHQTIAGAIALLGPNRLPYRSLFAILRAAQEALRETLTNSLYKFKITFRKPAPAHLTQDHPTALFIENSNQREEE